MVSRVSTPRLHEGQQRPDQVMVVGGVVGVEHRIGTPVRVGGDQRLQPRGGVNGPVLQDGAGVDGRR
jgi:hypothetical protein